MDRGDFWCWNMLALKRENAKKVRLRQRKVPVRLHLRGVPSGAGFRWRKERKPFALEYFDTYQAPVYRQQNGYAPEEIEQYRQAFALAAT